MEIIKPTAFRIKLNKEERETLEKMKNVLTNLEVAIDRIKDAEMDWEFEDYDDLLDLNEISDRIRSIL